MHIVANAPPSLSISDASSAERWRSAAARNRLWSFWAEHVLGTRLEVLVNTSSHSLATAAVDAARREIERLNLVFNHRLNDSELSNLNRTGRIAATADLFAVVQLAETWRYISRGAFDARMGELLRLWMKETEPTVSATVRAHAALQRSAVTLDPIERCIDISNGTILSLDAIAKGFIVDAAFNAASRASPGIEGIAIGIGGDVRCWGNSAHRRGWSVGIPDAVVPAENAPIVDAVSLNNMAIATSGRGPRDLMGKKYRSTTISPFTGHPVGDVMSVSVIASHVADADAIATACMVLDPIESIATVDRLGMAARIVDIRGRVHESSGWPALRLASTKVTPKSSSNKVERAAEEISRDDKNPILQARRWPADWEIGITYSEPDRKEQQGADFRTPYIALWISDEQGKPVRTVFMLGTGAKWHRDNFIWWGSNGERAAELVDLRSQATTLSGRYQVYWGAIDDDWKPVPIGKYTLHLETSQEHGKHSHRTVSLDIGDKRFKMSLPNATDSGGLEITYGHYNDRFKSDD
jgi:FAD:protein FMN transferase